MTRLTSGISSSPYLASQVLRQLASDYEESYPRAAEVVRSAFYVDDCLTGAETVEEAVELRQELNQLLSKACMTLRKWRSNSSAMLDTIPSSLRETSSLSIALTPTQCGKALGLR